MGIATIMRKRVFISFDYDNDDELRDALVGQAKLPNSPFEIVDYSLKERIESKWKEEVRSRIRKTDLVIVICGEHTDVARGVAAELSITREENKPYFLLRGRPDKTCKKPPMAAKSDKIYTWSWDNLSKLIAGAR